MFPNTRAVLPGEGGAVTLADLPLPAVCAPGEVRVAMLRAPINPADLLIIDGRYSIDVDRSQPIGAEGVGVVEAVGEGVDDLSPGDRVLPLTRGNWSRYRVMPRRHVIALPADLDLPDEQAAMLRINPLTARLLLDAAGVSAGDAVVQNGAGSAVAWWVRLIAAYRGVAVTDVVRRALPDHPHALIDGPDLAERVKAATDRPVRAALDCVAGSATERMATCLAPGGRLLLFGHLSGEPVTIRSQLLTGGGLSITGFSLRPVEAALGRAGIDALFTDLFTLLRRAPPALPVRAVVPLSRAGEAVALAREGSGGRVLIDLTQ